MRFERDRKRRVIYNDDADQVYNDFRSYDYQITDAQSFLDTRTTLAFGTHVDTYVWCVGNGADPPWGAAGGKLWPFLKDYDHAADLIVDACRGADMEVWGSLRMNDLHDSFKKGGLETTAEPIKAEHPEYLIGSDKERGQPEGFSERLLWTALDYERPEVRDYRLSFVEKNASRHDFDGYELDFTRFVWYFQFGRERECAPLMTDLVRDVRKTLDEIGAKRGRPYTLAVHLPDSPSIALDLGLDIKAWLDEKLVDVIVAGMGYVVYSFDLAQWQALAKPYGVPVYPSINAAIFTKKYVQLPGGPKPNESMRGVSAYWWSQGVDGMCLFNQFVLQDDFLGGFPRDYTFAPFSEVGDPACLAGKDKVYGVQRSSDRSTLQHGSEMTHLPAALDNNEFEMPLLIGPDAEDPAARIKLCALARGGDAETNVNFRLNHVLLAPTKEEDWYVVEVPAGLLRAGHNRLAIWCDVALAEAKTPVIIERVAVMVTYA